MESPVECGILHSVSLILFTLLMDHLILLISPHYNPSFTLIIHHLPSLCFRVKSEFNGKWQGGYLSTVKHNALAGIEPTTFRLVRRATSCATETTLSDACGSIARFIYKLHVFLMARCRDRASHRHAWT